MENVIIMNKKVNTFGVDVTEGDSHDIKCASNLTRDEIGVSINKNG